MAIKELFYDQRPVVLLNPRASQRIDPRFKFTRNGPASYYDRDGVLRVMAASADQPRIGIAHEITQTGDILPIAGLLLEKQSTNYTKYSQNLTDNFWQKIDGITVEAGYPAPDGTNTAFKLTSTLGLNARFLAQNQTGYTGGSMSVYIKKGNYRYMNYMNFYAFDFDLERFHQTSYGGPFSVLPPSGSYFEKLPGGWYRICCVNTSSGFIPFLQFSFYPVGSFAYVWGPQTENINVVTSYIPTTGNATVTRPADILSIEAPLPSTGSIYIDARALTANVDDTLISLKNASNQKIDLAFLSNANTFNSTALLANYNGTTKTTLPLPVPTTNRERNIITWGTANYQYGRDGSRFAPSLSTSVPADLNSLSIGSDSVDPTKALNGYINNVYLWNGELTPAIAEALIRNEVEAINADTFSPVGPAGALSLVINTQGAAVDGNKVFTLPAESALNDNDIVITWGDNTESGLAGAAAEVGAAGLAHTYPAAGIYPVYVEGKLQNLFFNNSADAKDLLEISAWGTSAGGNAAFTAPSTMNSAFYGCTQLQSIPSTNLPNTSAVTNWFRAFRDCSSLTGTFRAFNFSAATTFEEAFYNCSGITSFTAAGDQTQNVTKFVAAWYGCSGLTSFPLINTAAGTNFSSAWFGCSGLTSFPLINTSAGTNFSGAWQLCSGLTSFPLINTAAGTSFSNAWNGCSGLTSFPLINTAAGTNFSNAWSLCTGLTSFPLINTAAGTNFSTAWNDCLGLTSFPLINTAAGTNFSRAWRNNKGLTSFPALDFDAATGLASDSSTIFNGFRETWIGCSALTAFPPNLFDNTTCTRYLDAFRNCALTAASIENIIVSINAAGTSNGNLSLEGGTNAGASTWTANAVTAYNALVARGWTITRNA